MSSAVCEQSPVGFLEPALLAFGLNLPNHGCVDRGVWGLAIGCPKAIVDHPLDDVPASHGLIGCLENLGGNIQAAAFFAFLRFGRRTFAGCVAIKAIGDRFVDGDRQRLDDAFLRDLGDGLGTLLTGGGFGRLNLLGTWHDQCSFGRVGRNQAGQALPRKQIRNGVLQTEFFDDPLLLFLAAKGLDQLLGEPKHFSVDVAIVGLCVVQACGDGSDRIGRKVVADRFNHLWRVAGLACPVCGLQGVAYFPYSDVVEIQAVAFAGFECLDVQMLLGDLADDGVDGFHSGLRGLGLVCEALQFGVVVLYVAACAAYAVAALLEDLGDVVEFVAVGAGGNLPGLPGLFVCLGVAKDAVDPDGLAFAGAPGTFDACVSVVAFKFNSFDTHLCFSFRAALWTH